MTRRSVSINDVAQLAGVSPSTVSNVLNGKGRVSEKTRKRVLKIAHDEGYVPNFAAKSLRERHTRSIGIITPDVSNVFFAGIVLGVETRLHEAGYDSYICNTSNDAGRELDYIRGLTQKQVDGFVFVGGMSDISPDELGEDVPAVLVDRPARSIAASPRHVAVGNDISGMVASMVDTMAGHGRTHIVYLMITRRTDSFTGGRYEGYLAGLERNGLPLDERLVLRTPHRERSYVEAEHAIDALVESGVPFDGVACIGDRLALGVLSSLEKHGLVAGRDVLVMGMDDSPYSRIVSPSLSTIQRHPDEMAREGAEAMLHVLAGEPADDVVVPYEVVERATTLG